MNELIPLIEQLASDAPEISPWMFGSLLAKAHVEVDCIDEALGQLEAFAASGFDLRLDHVWLSGMVDYADAAVACGDPTYAWPLFERLAPWHAQLPATSASALPPVSHYLGGLAGVLGRYDEADAYFSQSAARVLAWAPLSSLPGRTCGGETSWPSAIGRVTPARRRSA